MPRICSAFPSPATLLSSGLASDEGTPGWYYNIRADPAIQVIYRDKKAEAVAREAQGEERQAIWEQARQIYAG